MRWLVIISLLMGASASADPCTPEELRKIEEFQRILNADKSQVLQAQVKMTALKFVKAAGDDHQKNLSGFIQTETEKLIQRDSGKVREMLKQFYLKHRAVPTGIDVNQFVTDKITEFKNASTTSTSTLDNDDLSAFIFAHQKVDPASPFDVYDEAATWAVQYMNTDAAQESKGVKSVNIPDLSAQISTSLGAGNPDSELERIFSQQIDHFSELETLVKKVPAKERCEGGAACKKPLEVVPPVVTALRKNVEKIIKKGIPGDVRRTCISLDMGWTANAKSTGPGSFSRSNPRDDSRAISALYGFFDRAPRTYFGIPQPESITGCCTVTRGFMANSEKGAYIIVPKKGTTEADQQALRKKLSGAMAVYERPYALEIQRRVARLFANPIMRDPELKTKFPAMKEIYDEWNSAVNTKQEERTAHYFSMIGFIGSRVAAAEKEIQGAGNYATFSLGPATGKKPQFLSILTDSAKYLASPMPDAEFDSFQILYRGLTENFVRKDCTQF